MIICEASNLASERNAIKIFINSVLFVSSCKYYELNVLLCDAVESSSDGQSRSEHFSFGEKQRGIP